VLIRRTTLGTSLVAALAVGAIAAAPAPARPLDPGYSAGSGDPGISGTTSDQSHRYYHEQGSPQFQAGQPTWPAHPKPAGPAGTPLPPHASGGDDTVWIIGLAAGAVAAALSAAGFSRQTRVRAHRVAV
jgi:hypothetical protein